MEELKYPVGMQSFPEIRERGFVYVDKTRYIPMIMDLGKYFFLGRPRRFGKSLFLSTLHAYFDGRKELFDGLVISEIEKEWKSSPVLHIDFTGTNYTVENSLRDAFESILNSWENIYDITEKEKNQELRFQKVISTAYEKTGRKVVILIDEYDKPLIDTIELPVLQETFRNKLRGIYGNLKRMDSYIQFAFLTGISRFGKLNIFSDLNNLNDISMKSEFSGICGVTVDELHKYFHQGVKSFADKRGCGIDEMYEILRVNYDGYHFSPESAPDVYNPFSLIKSLQDKAIGEYWFSTGTPLFLVKRIKSHAIDLEEFNKVDVTQPEIENIPFDMEGDPIPILYQSGYLTIKEYDPKTGIITLGYPNREVERGFLDQLLKVYVPKSYNRSSFSILKLYKDIESGNVEEFMQRLESLFASISYDSFDLMDLEQHYRNVIYLLFKLLGYYVHAEYRTATGRIDMLLETEKFIYLFEFKLNKSANKALAQIDTKEYMLPFKLDSRETIKIGANFSTEKKNFDGWLIERG